MTDSRFLDSSAWLSYFYAESKEIKEFIESEDILFTSVISLLEIKNKLLQEKIKNERIYDLLEFVEKRSILVNIDKYIILLASTFTAEKKLHTVDALLYASAIKKQATFITLDNDFRGLEKTIILKKS